MSLCIPTYMLASSLIEGGMNWWQALLTIFLGNSIVLVPMLLNGRAGAQVRHSVSGVCAGQLWRAGGQCAGAAARHYCLRLVRHPNLDWRLRALPDGACSGCRAGHAAGHFPGQLGPGNGAGAVFLLFWLLNMYVVYLGVESIRKLLVFKAFFLPVAALALLWWAISAGNGLGPILAQPGKFTSSAAFWAFFFPSLTGMVGFWATLSLNIPDFTRYATSQRAQLVGQALGLPAVHDVVFVCRAWW